MLHLPSKLAFYGFVGIVGAWTAMLFGWSTKNIVLSQIDAQAYGALSLNIAPRISPEAVNFISPEAGGSIAADSRLATSVAATILRFGTNGNERYEVIKDGTKPLCVDSDITLCPDTKSIEGKQGKAVVINKSNAWAEALPGTSWISLKKGTGSGHSGIASDSVVRFTKRINLPEGATMGVIAIMADDNVVAYVDGKKVFTSPTTDKGLVKKPAVFAVYGLKPGKHALAFDVRQNDKTDGKPFGFNGQFIFLQPSNERGQTQAIASGTQTVRLASTAFLTPANALSLQSVSVTLARKNPKVWQVPTDAPSKDFANLALVDDTTGAIIATIPQLTIGYTDSACQNTSKGLVCTFGSKAKPLNYALASANFGEVKGYSVYADVLTSNTTKEVVVTLNEGVNTVLRKDKNTYLNVPAGAGPTLTLTPASTPAVKACVDGIDNDGDRKIDGDDVGCQGSTPAGEDDNEADDQAVREERLKARDARRQAAVDAIADAIVSVVGPSGTWSCSVGALPQSAKEISSRTGGYNLAQCLVPAILADLPVDPGRDNGVSANTAQNYYWKSATDYVTGYRIAYSVAMRKVVIYAFNAEGRSQIRAERTLPETVATTPSVPPTPTTPTTPTTPPTTPVAPPTPPAPVTTPALPSYASCNERERWFTANKKRYNLSFGNGKSFDCNEFEGKVAAVMMFYDALSSSELLDAKMPGKKKVGKFVADQARAGIFKGGSGCEEGEFAYANSLGEIHLCSFWTQNFTGTDLAADISSKTLTTLFHEAAHIYMKDFSHVQCPASSRYKGSSICDTRLSKKPFAVGDTRETGAYNFEFWLMASMKKYFEVPTAVLASLDRQLSDFVANRFKTVPSKNVADYLKEL